MSNAHLTAFCVVLAFCVLALAGAVLGLIAVIGHLQGRVTAIQGKPTAGMIGQANAYSPRLRGRFEQ